MPTIHQELDLFTEFMKQKVPSHDSGPSLEECLRQWRDEQELAETIEAIADIEAGRVMSIEEAGQQIRAKFGWPALDE